jgi:hypothetical protein
MNMPMSGVAILLVVAFMSTPTAHAQYQPYYTPRAVKGQVFISSPGSIAMPGRSTATTFSTISYGLRPQQNNGPSGPLAAGIADRGMNTTFTTILPSQYRSPQSSPGAHNISGQPLTGATSNSQLPPMARSSTTSTPYTDTRSPANRTANIRPVQRTAITPQNTATTAAHTYLQSISEDVTEDDDPPSRITSLASKEPGLLRDHMIAGEKAFQRGIYTRAMHNFKLAREISLNSPESNLALCHTYFAMGDTTSLEGTASEGAPPLSYNQPCLYLIQAIRPLPELALLPLEPKEFWGELRDYGDRLAELETYCEEQPEDPEALLLLAYFKWFESDTDAAADALVQAYPHATNEDTAEAIETFWDGMRASGQVPEDTVLPPRGGNSALEELAPADIPDDEDSENSLERLPFPQDTPTQDEF